MSSLEENKQLIRRLTEAVSTIEDPDEAIEACESSLDEGFESRAGDPWNEVRTFEKSKKLFKEWATAFKGKYTIEDIIAEGDKVVVRGAFIGTQKGEWKGVRPSNKHVEMPMVDIFRIANGKIVQHWGIEDCLGLSQQAGAESPPY
jgi:ketosteroid isomerase-like protein